MIRSAVLDDAKAILDIYNYYITHSVVTFEEVEISVNEMVQRIQKVFSLDLPWLVAEEGGEILGYAYANAWHARSAYQYSVEISAYLAPSAISKGLGTKLYKELFSKLEKTKVHTAIGGIALPNEASVALHEKFGMHKAAHYKDVGFKFDQWIDVGYWQILI